MHACGFVESHQEGKKKVQLRHCGKHTLAAPSRTHCWQISGTRDVLESQENIAGSKSAGTKLCQG